MPGPIKHIRTYTNKDLDLRHLTFDDICIEDIAHALACLNRFNGHARRPISVAQHSVYVGRMSDGPYQLQGLLHDAAEAYIGDVTKWLKQLDEMRAFRELEDHIQTVIYAKFGCPLEMHESVSYADRIMVRFEGTQLFDDFLIDHPRYPPLTEDQIQKVGKWAPWSWHESEDLFLDHFRMYATVSL